MKVFPTEEKAISNDDTQQIIPQWFCRLIHDDVIKTTTGNCSNQNIQQLMESVSKSYHWVQIEKILKF